jgi:hypothetical protein
VVVESIMKQRSPRSGILAVPGDVCRRIPEVSCALGGGENQGHASIDRDVAIEET